MDLADRLKQLAARIPTQLDRIQTEEATKNALVMPFITALGYDVFDPGEVTPELVADVGIKKGEKVDYAILKDGKPIILFECKSRSANLNLEHASQLHRYFHVTDARIGVLTNGLQYRFYSDLERPNAMDAVPFLEIDMLALKDADLEEVRQFSKSYFDEAAIVTNANELKYTRELKRLLVEEFKTPSPDFVRFFAAKMHAGRITQNILDAFTEYLKRAYRQVVSEQISDRLQSALDAEIPRVSTLESNVLTPEVNGSNIETTAEEVEGLYIIKSILREDVELSRVVIRDVQSYCGILLDDNNRKPIIRFYFDQRDRKIGLFDNPERKEEKIGVGSLDDIYKHALRIVQTVQNYEKQTNSIALQSMVNS
jgi:predicted type IV restriction endonuclease